MDDKQTYEELKKRLKEIDIILNASTILAYTNSKGEITYANDRFCEISQYSREELIGSNQSIVNSGYHSRNFFKEMWRTIGTGYIWKGQIRNRAKDGTYYWVDTTIVPFMNKKGKPEKYAAIRYDITKLKEYEAIIKERAYYDFLTGLPNRNWLNDWIEYEAPYQTNQVAIFFLDLNRFKSVNDYYGHSYGDLILKEIAERLNSVIKEPDFIVRQGGDEFVVFITSTSCESSILYMLNKIKQQFEKPIWIDGYSIILSTSIGVSMTPIDWMYADDITLVLEETIKRADRAMYQAKKIKGNAHVFHTNKQNRKIERMIQLEQEIVHAVNEDQLYVLYQPIIDLEKERITGVEALMRWNHPELGLISPVEFIPLLDELGLIVEVGNWVIDNVCEQMYEWYKAGIDIGRVAVNVSPIQFKSEVFLEKIQQKIADTSFDTSRLELEVTEQQLIDVDNMFNVLSHLKEMGISIAIDDFGTGYSSLNYITKLPINRLKIDREFIHHYKDKANNAVMNMIFSLANTLGHIIVAEGVETKEQKQFLLDKGCQEAQGFYWIKVVKKHKVFIGVSL
ncbi:MAG TPA: GGDEF and EAL domain-containing protein [Pseudogracilibacillus sp.]|nr:GGDEF and EAL domain-containing protein [Pseudogracilibacillus sp.]